MSHFQIIGPGLRCCSAAVLVSDAFTQPSSLPLLQGYQTLLQSETSETNPSLAAARSAILPSPH
eukprot:138277-Hanusia_phi.AAC.1